jgi:hypothetical protein
LTLLADDTESSNDDHLWNIYYHLYPHEKPLVLVQAQAKKLHCLSPSIDSWPASKYSNLLRICDQKTLIRVREIWKSYCTTDLNKDERSTHDDHFKFRIQKALDAKARFLDHGLVLTGFRSAAPVGVQSASDLSELY